MDTWLFLPPRAFGHDLEADLLALKLEEELDVVRPVVQHERVGRAQGVAILIYRTALAAVLVEEGEACAQKLLHVAHGHERDVAVEALDLVVFVVANLAGRPVGAALVEDAGGAGELHFVLFHDGGQGNGDVDKRMLGEEINNAALPGELIDVLLIDALRLVSTGGRAEEALVNAVGGISEDHGCAELVRNEASECDHTGTNERSVH